MNDSDSLSNTSASDSRKWTIRYLTALAVLSGLWWLMYSSILPVSEWLVFQLLGLSPDSGAGTALEFFLHDTVKILLLLVALIYGISWVRASLSVERVRDYLSGKRRGPGYVLGALFGSITPFCSCSSIPLFLGFTMARIPLGITMAFLITSPLINELAVVLLWSLLGWKFTVFYIVIGMGSGIIGGWFMDTIRAERWLQPFIQESLNSTFPRQQGHDMCRLTLRQRHDFACGETRTILGRVWKWVILGVGIGAFLHGFVPENWFAEKLGSGEWWTVPAAVLAGIPLYTNVTGIVPVMDSLLSKGLPIGTTLSFCMSAVVASIPEIMMLRQIMTARLLLAFVSYLMVIFTLIGWMFNIPEFRAL